MNADVFKLDIFGEKPVPAARSRTVALYGPVENGERFPKTKEQWWKTPRGGKVLVHAVMTTTYDEPKSKAFKLLVNTLAVAKVQHIPFFEDDQALMLTAEFLFERPKSVPEKKRPHFIVKPDIKNLVAQIEDALEDVVYRNDSRIVAYDCIRKRYAKPGEVQGIYIKIQPYVGMFEEEQERIAKLENPMMTLEL